MNGNWYNGTGSLDATGKYARVSSILDVRNKPELVDWKVRVGAEEAAEISLIATIRGTAVHDAIEQYIKTGDVVVLPDEYAPFFNGFKNWFDKVQPTECTTELALRSDTHMYAGRTDLICTIDGERWIVDFKTSKRFDPGMGLQLAAYREAYKEMTGEECQTGILRLTNLTQKGYQWREYSEDFGVFLAHKQIFDWVQASKKPAVEEADSTWDGRTLKLEVAA